MATNTKTAPKNPKPSAAIRKEDGTLAKQKDLPVWFEATCSHLPIESHAYEYYGQGAKLKRHKVEGLELVFDPKLGRTKSYSPTKPTDLKLIEAVRKWLKSDDERVRQFSVRESRPGAGSPPFPKWNETKATALSKMVKDGGWDIDRCVRYEQLTLGRADVLSELEKLSAVAALEGVEPATLKADLG